jgi:hypothetical protein
VVQPGTRVLVLVSAFPRGAPPRASPRLSSLSPSVGVAATARALPLPERGGSEATQRTASPVRTYKLLLLLYACANTPQPNRRYSVPLRFSRLFYRNPQISKGGCATKTSSSELKTAELTVTVTAPLTPSLLVCSGVGEERRRTAASYPPDYGLYGPRISSSGTACLKRSLLAGGNPLDVPAFLTCKKLIL